MKRLIIYEDPLPFNKAAANAYVIQAFSITKQKYIEAHFFLM